MIYGLFWLVSLYLLFQFKSSGRTLFTILVVLAVPLTLAMPDYYSMPSGNVYEMLNWLGGLLDGAMLAMLYLTGIKDKFQKVEE